MLTKHCALRLAFQLQNFNLKYSIFHHFPEHLYIKQRSFGDATILSKNPRRELPVLVQAGREAQLQSAKEEGDGGYFGASTFGKQFAPTSNFSN
jgi:hypothetical protein